MTSEYAGPSEPELRRIFAHAECLLLDFDGPLCDLFRGRPAPGIAELMHLELARQGVVLGPEAAGSANPARILRAVTDRGLSAALEKLLAEEEEAAAHSALPTPGAEDVVRASAHSGRTLAVTTNNSPAAVNAYLKDRSLDTYFDSRVFGRDPDDPARMKPHPDCLLRAVDSLGVRPENCLMIGDSAADATAAEAAKVHFLGFAHDGRSMRELRRWSGGRDVITTWRPVLRVFATP
ncbi:HAD-IA family hydrolase [Streptomyces sp. NPDC008139]|uniref:HAD family hydrolase n=1 Tax=Streptomyces sp. NPDC008139 TaxID=3364814 RepID=UPI0036F02956